MSLRILIEPWKKWIVFKLLQNQLRIEFLGQHFRQCGLPGPYATLNGDEIVRQDVIFG